MKNENRVCVWVIAGQDFLLYQHIFKKKNIGMFLTSKFLLEKKIRLFLDCIL